MAKFRKSSAEKAVAKQKRDKAKNVARTKVHDARFVASRAVLIAALIVVCAVPVFFAASPITYVPLIAVVVLLALSFAYLQVLKRGFSYSEESLSGSCERGTAANLEVVFKNSTPLPLIRLDFCLYTSNLFGEIDAEVPSSLVLMPGEEYRYRFEAIFDHIGTYSAGVSRIAVGDLLGLFQHTIVNTRRHKVTVLPKRFDLRNLSLERVSVQDNSKAFQPVVTDDMDYAGVRDYAPGDPLKTVHWKLSSRNTEGNYYTRLFEAFGNPSINIIIDRTAPEYDAESLMGIFDCIMESTLAIARKAREVGLDAVITFPDKAGEPQSMYAMSVEDSSDLISAIPKIEVASGAPAKQILRRNCQSIHGDGNVAFCTAHVDEETIECLLSAKLRKRNPMLVLAVPRVLEGRELAEFTRPLKRLAVAQIPYYVVSDAKELEGEVS